MDRKKIYYFVVFLFVTGIIIACLPLIAGAGDPSGAATGTVKDLAAKEAGKPLLAEIAEAVGHNKISINFIWTLITGYQIGRAHV